MYTIERNLKMKRNTLYTVIVAFALIISTALCCRKVGAELKANAVPDSQPSVNKVESFGVNLSGAEFGSNVPGTYDYDYSYPLLTDLDYVKSKGWTLVRLPFLWNRLQPTLNGDLDPVELKRLTDFVDAANEKGINILLDAHNFGRRRVNGQDVIIGAPDVPVSSFADFWGKMAAVFKSKTNIWGYGMMNEPHDMLTDVPWLVIAQKTIDQIRTVDTKTTIVVAGDSFSSASRWNTVSDNLKTITDPSSNLIFEAHTYFDANSSGAYTQSYDLEKATPTIGVERLAPFVNWLKVNNKRGFVGEYGIPDDDPRWLVTLDNALNYLKSNCINGTYWSAGPRWGSDKLAVQPINGVDRPQMQVLKNYVATDPKNCQ